MKTLFIVLTLIWLTLCVANLGKDYIHPEHISPRVFCGAY